MPLRLPAASTARIEWAAVALLTIAAALVAGTNLDGHSLWLDEAATVAVSGHTLRELVDALWRFDQLPVGALYYVLVWTWMQVFGDSEAEVLIVDPNRGNRSAFNRRMAGAGFALHDMLLSEPLADGRAYRGRLLSYRR